MNDKTIKVLHLYARDMNIYGDRGNVLTLLRRIQWHGYMPQLLEYNPGDKFPTDVDIIVGGGGQDSGQSKIQDDLIAIGPALRKLADDGTPMLVICGLYQLFGKFFKTSSGEVITGIGLLDVETFGKSERLIGNIITHSEQFGDIVGYENHSGQTYLGHQVESLGRVRLGAGNNVEDVSEGARYKNVIGSYLHGSLLPKNPSIADYLIQQAAVNKYGRFEGNTFDDRISDLARKAAMKRPR